MNELAVVAAVVTAVVAIVAVWIQAAYTRFTVRMDIFWQLEREFYHEDRMIARRRAAAAALLEKGWTIEVDEMLGFFDTVGILVRRRVIDEDLAFHSFGRRVLCYWEFARGRVEARRRDHPGIWGDVDYLVNRLRKRRENQEKHPPRSGWQAEFDEGARNMLQPYMVLEAGLATASARSGAPHENGAAQTTAEHSASSAPENVHGGLDGRPERQTLPRRRQARARSDKR